MPGAVRGYLIGEYVILLTRGRDALWQRSDFIRREEMETVLQTGEEGQIMVG